MMIVLLRIIRQRLLAQFSTHPREIKRMFQEMLLRDVIVDLIEMFVHKMLVGFLIDTFFDSCQFNVLLEIASDTESQTLHE